MTQETLKVRRIAIDYKAIATFVLEMESSDPDNQDFPFIIKLVQETSEIGEGPSWYFDEDNMPVDSDLDLMGLTEDEFKQKCVELVSSDAAFIEFKDLKKPKKCDQCASVTINGVFCHERGCPNTFKDFDPETGEWVEQEEEGRDDEEEYGGNDWDEFDGSEDDEEVE